MVIEKVTGINISNIELIERGLSLEAYTDALGWSHEGLVNLAHFHGLKAERIGGVSNDDLVSLLNGKQLFIASIKWAFLPKKNLMGKFLFWKRKGGHLALVTERDETGFYVHHTSIKKDYNWKDTHISFSQFKNSFTGRGVIISLSK